jgi:hypothetical protein
MKNCPFCGATFACEPVIGGLPGGMVAACCPACGAHGPACSAKDQALRAWDRRGGISEIKDACVVEDESGPTMPYAVRLAYEVLERLEIQNDKLPKLAAKRLIEHINNKLITVRGNVLVEASHAVQALR